MCYVSPSRVLPLVFLSFYCAVIQRITVFIKKTPKKIPLMFCAFVASPYFCTRFRKRSGVLLT